ncbi:hypothetical protein F4780DRAFT_3448 [Xylariomycetidae sp. FL0641]|nr:hypothetical protein F4780DRAFT_3448 [Xylariomycetidae sp. FL0641]
MDRQQPVVPMREERATPSSGTPYTTRSPSTLANVPAMPSPASDTTSQRCGEKGEEQVPRTVSSTPVKLAAQPPLGDGSDAGKTSCPNQAPRGVDAGPRADTAHKHAARRAAVESILPRRTTLPSHRGEDSRTWIEGGERTTPAVTADAPSHPFWGWNMSKLSLDYLPNEVLMHILGFLDVGDLLVTSRVNHHFRILSTDRTLHASRLRQARQALPPLLTSPSRPTLADLIARHIFLTHTTQISRRLARNLVAIRLSHRLPQRPSADALVQRGVLPPECRPPSTTAPGSGFGVAPALVVRRREVEKARLKDGLRRWVGAVWKGEVRQRGEGVRQCEENAGIGRVWRLRRFWERVGRGDEGRELR